MVHPNFHASLEMHEVVEAARRAGQSVEGQWRGVNIEDIHNTPLRTNPLLREFRVAFGGGVAIYWVVRGKSGIILHETPDGFYPVFLSEMSDSQLASIKTELDRLK